MLSQEGTTQGDPLAMAMYAIGILPLIQRLSSESTKQTWYADDAAACGDLTHLRSWWDQLVDFGPTYGYHPNASKTWLIVKEEKFEEATTAFEGTGVSITQEGKRHLGAALGTIKFIESYVKNKVSEWVHEIEVLSTFAVTQPHAAYAAFTHGLTSRWTFLARTTPNIGNLLQPLEEAIRLKFLPALTGKAAFSDDIRDLLVCQYALVALVSLIQPASPTFTTHLPRMSRLHSCPSSLNSPRPIPPIASSRRKNRNVLLTIPGDYTKRTVPSNCPTDYLSV